MKNNRKTSGIIIIILGFLLIALIVYLFFFNKSEPSGVIEEEKETAISGQLPSGEEKEIEDPNITPSDRPQENDEYNISQEESHEINEQDLIKLAMVFAERFGSYSNYSNYSNFSDLKIFMTAKMKNWAENYVDSLKNSNQGGDEYFGVTTKAISSKVLEYNENVGQAVISIITKRQENSSQIDAGKNYNQDIEITLDKVNGVWLVDSAYWQ